MDGIPFHSHIAWSFHFTEGGGGGKKTHKPIMLYPKMLQVSRIPWGHVCVTAAAVMFILPFKPLKIPKYEFLRNFCTYKEHPKLHFLTGIPRSLSGFSDSETDDNLLK